MNICLYGASSNQIDQSFITAVEELGKELGRRGHSLVYGGGANGLMGAAARGTVCGGGSVIGIAPSFFQVDGVLFEDCTEFIYTETMRERKQIMEDRAEAFIVTPGGPGTFDEFFEILTLKQLGQHKKPVAIFNVNGYYDHMIQMLQNAVSKGFMTKECKDLAPVFGDHKALLDYLEGYDPEDYDFSVLKKVNG